MFTVLPARSQQAAERRSVRRHNVKLDQVGHDAPSDRDLYMLALDRIEELPADFRLPSKHFACLIVGDTRHLGEGDIHRFAGTLLRAGAVYLCAWGPGSDRIRGLLDDAILMSEYESSDEAFIPTTAHGEELGEALGSLLFCTGASPAYQESCHAALALLIGASEHAAIVQQALEDPKAFVAALCLDEGAAEQAVSADVE